MDLATRIRSWFTRRSVKSSDIAFIPEWRRTSWPDITFERLTSEGYKLNAAVNICATRLALSYQQPRPIAKNIDGDVDPNHPLQTLLHRPNPDMSWQELAILISVYKSIGGNCYLKKVRSGARRVVELWPYHIGQMRPVPGRFDWVAGYEYNSGDGIWKPVEKVDIIHLKWPVPDPDQPWVAMGAIRSIAREVDTDNEATRYQYALLVNDAVTSGTVELPEGVTLTDPQYQRLVAQWSQRHGGDRRGGVAILERGGKYNRTALSLEELAFDTLRKVPEARISSGFLIPPEYSGLTVGQEHSTYNNKSEARQAFFEDGVVPLCELDAGELTQQLSEEFGGRVTVGFDYSKVVALQENEDAKFTRALGAWERGVLTRNEARVYLGFPRVEDMQIAPGAEPLPPGDMFKTAQASAPVSPPMIDVTPQPLQLTDTQKGRKAKAPPSLQTIERRIEKAMQSYLHEQYMLAAASVRG